MVKLPPVATQVLPLAGTSPQVPMMEPLLRAFVVVFTVPVTSLLLRVTTSPALEVKVNENVPLTWKAALTVTFNVPPETMVEVPKQVPEFSS